jgi:glutaredoxin-related protein
MKMAKDKNVIIPYTLLLRTIELLEYINKSMYDFVIQQDYDDILHAFNEKKRRIELRDTYAEIVHAKDEDSRHDARMRYLWQKRYNSEYF